VAAVNVSLIRLRHEVEQRVRREYERGGLDAVLTFMHQHVENQRREAADQAVCAVFDAERDRGNLEILPRLTALRDQIQKAERPEIAEGVVKS
jgi:hypothetical protein